jgi:hypothetical protein
LQAHRGPHFFKIETNEVWQDLERARPDAATTRLHYQSHPGTRFPARAMVGDLAAQAPRKATPIYGNWAANGLINRNLGTSMTRVRQALDTVVNYFANRLEEFNPRIRQVLSHRRRNVKAFV